MSDKHTALISAAAFYSGLLLLKEAGQTGGALQVALEVVGSGLKVGGAVTGALMVCKAIYEFNKPYAKPQRPAVTLDPPGRFHDINI